MIHGTGIPFYSKSTLYADKLLSMHQGKGDFRSLKRGHVDMVADYLAPPTPAPGQRIARVTPSSSLLQ